MPGGLMTPISDEVKEQVLGEYLAGNSINTIAVRQGLAWATVKKIVTNHQAEIDDLQADQRKELVVSSLSVAHAYLEELAKPATIKKAKPRDMAVIYGILLDKWQKEQELATTFDAVLEGTKDLLLATMREELKGDPALQEQMARFIERREAALMERARWKRENQTDGLKKRAQGRRTTSARGVIKIGDQEYDGSALISSLSNAGPELQLAIMEAWADAADPAPSA